MKFNPFLYSKIICSGALLAVVWTLIACQPPTVPAESVLSNNNITDTITKDTTQKVVPTSLKKTVANNMSVPRLVATSNPLPTFPWLATYDPATSILQQIPVPAGYQRLELADNSFGYWLRQLPLHPKGTAVLLYNGMTKPYQAGAHRVLNMDIGKRDLQQCADAVMRLRAEYLYQQKNYAAIHFNYTSGHTIRFSDWSKGKRPRVSGSNVTFSAPKGTIDTSYPQFKRYLTNVYSYAGTASLSKELQKKAIASIEPGDVFIQGGFPGHAILVMDVAQHPTTGERLFLLAQSYMPAQSIHLLNNPNNGTLSPWYSSNLTSLLETPEWTFNKQDLCSFED
ncbi:MAG: DUF4846 domain-containing protein [Aureispira sp.]